MSLPFTLGRKNVHHRVVLGRKAIGSVFLGSKLARRQKQNGYTLPGYPHSRGSPLEK